MSRRRVLVVSLSACLLLACWATTAAWADRGHVFSGVIGEPCLVEPCAAGTLKEPTAAAVAEATGKVYVLDRATGRVVIYTAEAFSVGEIDGSGQLPGEGVAAGEGGGAEEIPTGHFSEPTQIAIDNSESSEDPSAGDIYVGDAGHGVIDKYSPEGAYLGQVTGTPASGAFTAIDGIAVDGEGELWVTDSHSGGFGAVDVFTSAIHNAYVESPPAVPEGFFESGLALDSLDDMYAHTNAFREGSNVIAKYSKGGVLLSRAVTNESPNGVAAEKQTDDVYVDSGDHVERFTPGGTPIESLAVAEAAGSGVAVDSTTGKVLVPDTATQTVEVFSLEPPGAPTLDGTAVSRVTGDSALLSAEVDPRGNPTSYVFEYGPCATVAGCAAAPFTSSSPVLQLPGDFEVHEVATSIEQLTPGTPYHFRARVENDHKESFTGEALTFSTRPAAHETALPDGRKWELVSPTDKHGAALQPIAEAGVIESSPDGDAITYLATGPTESGAQGSANQSQLLSLRSATGWSTSDIAIPHEGFVGQSVGTGQEYRFFSSDLSEAVVQPFGTLVPQLSAAASEQTPYLREDFVGSVASAICSASCFHPLVTGQPGIANVPPGTEFGDEQACPHARICGPEFIASNDAATAMVLRAPLGVVLTQGGAPGGLYEWVDGQIRFVGVGSLGWLDKAAENAVSTDGARVVFQGAAEGSEGLLLRNTETGHVLVMNAVQGGSGEGASAPVFQAATADDSIVWFTDEQRLTPDSGADVGSPDLYRCDVHEDHGLPECALTDLTPLESGGSSADVLGRVLGIGEDGDSVYFAANGELSSGAAQGTCKASTAEPAIVGAVCNLYEWHDGAIRRIATLQDFDRPDWALRLSGHTARVSPNGEWLAFMSQAKLTGYDNRDAVSGNPDEEVYLYDSTRSTLVCASCDPTGARPSGVQYGGEGSLYSGDRVWTPQQWIAANVPGWTPFELESARYQSRYLSNSGRLFFNSSSTLVSQDANGNQDVYEFEPPSASPSGCTEASPAYVPSSEGCLALISSGTGAGESAFLDASEDGGDVFFLTASRLAPSEDVDTSLDVYDAHECTPSAPCRFAPVGAPPPCHTAEECRSSSTSQAEALVPPASTSIPGAEPSKVSPTSKPAQPKLSKKEQLKRALKLCIEHKRQGPRHTCERRARARFAPKKQAKAKRSKAVRR